MYRPVTPPPVSDRPTMDNNVAAQFASAQIFCNDELLRSLQLAPWRPSTDSKTFVDVPLKAHPDEILDAFTKLQVNPNPIDAKLFLATYFHDSPEDDRQITLHQPIDYTPELPLFAINSNSFALKEFSGDLKSRWSTLARSFNVSVEERYARLPDNPYSSLIPLPYPFFVPGGRFRECYYWDTLWIVHGLLASDMILSAINVVRNLLYLVVNFGFVPNGNRVYYLNRSQPPVLAEAVFAVYERLTSVKDKRNWLLETVPILEREYETFMECRRAPGVTTASGDPTPLCVYAVKTSKPRPESYKEDIETAAIRVLKRNDSKVMLGSEGLDEVSNLILGQNKGPMEQTYQDIASGAESGWDFTSRWFGNHRKGLSSIKTSKIIPVCLNSVLLRCEKLLASFHHFLSGDEDDARHVSAAQKFTARANERAMAMNQLMWCPITKMWMDYDIEMESQTSVESAAGLMPLWAGCWEGAQWSHDDAAKVVEALRESRLMAKGGLATTTKNSGEQWDYPNCWAPLADFAATGLRHLEERFPGCGGGDTAKEIALRTLRSMYLGWHRDSLMHEKYDAELGDGSRGQGGEYEPQVGFGWSNGVALKLMEEYVEDIDNADEGVAFS